MNKKHKQIMNYNALSLFSSAGLAETYFSRKGVNVKVANELLPDRANFYKHLYPETKMICGDITSPKLFSEVINEAKKNKCNFLIATPPCQGMSTAGKKLKDDPRNRLIITVVKAIQELNPDFVIIENVPAILTTNILIDRKWVNVNDYLYSVLGKKYNFNDRKNVNTMYYGVAQSRIRCVYLLSKKKFKFNWEFPNPAAKVTTLRDAIGDLPSLDPNVTDITEKVRKLQFPEYYDKKEAGLAISKWHYPPRHKIRHVIAMQHTPEGCTAWNNNKYYPTLLDGSKSKGYKNTYKRQWWDKPAYTVTRYTSRLGSQENGHPGVAIINSPKEEKRLWSDARVFSIFELMRVSSLPDNWNIPEWASSDLIREIIGEGIPPRLLEAALDSLNNLVLKNSHFE
jgi:DNA (cytosine-5)-methyltransferase 1